jgi:hypothetical protein
MSDAEDRAIHRESLRDIQEINETAGMDTTVVIFRKWPASDGGGIIALFPYEPASPDGSQWCQSYMHVGQHGRAAYFPVIDGTRPASPEEYAALKRELESEPFNYRLTVRQRTPHDAGDVRTAAWRKLRARGAEGGNIP